MCLGKAERNRSQGLVMRRCQALAPLGAPPLQHEAAILGRHACAKAVCLGAATIVRLKGSFRHSQEFSIKTKSVRLKAGALYVKKRQQTKPAKYAIIRLAVAVVGSLAEGQASGRFFPILFKAQAANLGQDSPLVLCALRRFKGVKKRNVLVAPYYQNKNPKKCCQK